MLWFALAGCAFISIADHQDAVIEASQPEEFPELDLQLLRRPDGLDLCAPNLLRFSTAEAFADESLEFTIVVDGQSVEVTQQTAPV